MKKLAAWTEAGADDAMLARREKAIFGWGGGLQLRALYTRGKRAPAQGVLCVDLLEHIIYVNSTSLEADTHCPQLLTLQQQQDRQTHST
jgi:hypothetical protein